MSSINVQARIFKNYTLKFGSAAGAPSYEKHVSEVTLIPSSSVVTWKGAAPDATFSDVTNATWTCQLAYAQDWNTPESLSIYLLNHEGESVEVEFGPTGEATGPKFKVTVLITPGSIGGAIDAVGVATVTLGVSGKPVFTAGTVSGG